MPHPVGAEARNSDERAALIWKRLAEEKKALRCPEGYRWEDVGKDGRRLAELDQKRKDGELTPQEEAEDLHLTARVLSHQNSAEHAEREQLSARLAMLAGKWRGYSIAETEQEEFDRLRLLLRDVVTGPFDEWIMDPVAFPFYLQVCFDARMRGWPEPTVEEAHEMLAAKQSSADIIRMPSCPPGPDPDNVDFPAWLRGEVCYQPWQLRKAAYKRFGKYGSLTFEELSVALIREEEIVWEHELHPYFAWVLKFHDRAAKGGKPL